MITIKLNELGLRDFYIKYLEMVNLAISDSSKKLTDTEIKILSYFLLLDEDKFKHSRFGTVAKKKVAQMAAEDGWTLSNFNITGKLYSLYKKGFLYKDEDGVTYIIKELRGAIAMAVKTKQLKVCYEFNLF